MPTTGYLINGIDIGTLFGAKGPSTASATGYDVAGTDLNQILLSISDGQDIGINTGYDVGGTDLRSIFGSPQTSLPINGQVFSASSQSGTHASSSSYTFTANSSGWAVSGSSSGGGSVTTGTSGSNPPGAASVQFNVSIASSAGTFSTNNTAPSPVSLGSTSFANAAASGTPSTIDSHVYLNVQIIFYNAGNSAISTTNIQLRASAVGAS